MRKLVTLLTMVVALTSSAYTAPKEEPPTAAAVKGTPRVRPYDGRSAALLLQGIERSDTIRGIIEDLERQDLIVYIEMQPALRKNLAGTLTLMSAATTLRYVRISLNPSLSADALIATLGHELQHAREVAHAPSIVDVASLEAYYKKNGVSTQGHPNGWDTLAARITGDEVRREIASVRPSRVAESIQAFNPLDWQVVYRRARSMLPP